jgi:Type IV secretory system Conjugative DNA transfer
VRASRPGTTPRPGACLPLQDPDTARELSAMCGEYGVVATARGDSIGSQGRGAGFGTSSSGRSENRSEIRRALIKPEEIIQDTRADEAFVLVRGARPLRCGRALLSPCRHSAPGRRQPLPCRRRGGHCRVDAACRLRRQHLSRLRRRRPFGAPIVMRPAPRSGQQDSREIETHGSVRAHIHAPRSSPTRWPNWTA